jgi:hypothetical protein
MMPISFHGIIYLLQYWFEEGMNVRPIRIEAADHADVLIAALGCSGSVSIFEIADLAGGLHNTIADLGGYTSFP